MFVYEIIRKQNTPPKVAVPRGLEVLFPATLAGCTSCITIT